MLGKQSYPATGQGRIKGTGGWGGEEQSLCSPQCPWWAQRAGARVAVLSWCLSWAISHHLPSSQHSCCAMSPLLGRVWRQSPAIRLVPWKGTRSERPSTGHCSDHPRASFSCSRQLVPATLWLFEESSKSVFEMLHDETA